LQQTIKMRIILIILLSTLFSSVLLFSQSETKSFYNNVNQGYNFLLNIPDEYKNSEQKTPLIVFLHGFSLSGSDLNRVKKYGVIDAILRTNINPHAFVLAPQCPRGEHWNPDKVLNVMKWIKANYNIDSSRIYVVGMSMGGYGTFDFVGKYPDEVTAAIALCGAGNEKYAANMAKVPLWIMHGLADRDVPASRSKGIENAIKKDGRLNYTRANYFPGLNHADMVHVFYMPVMYKWLFQFDRTEDSKMNINNYEITLEDFHKRPIDGSYGAFGKEINMNKDIKIDSLQNTFHAKKQIEKKEIKKSKNIYLVNQGDTLYAIAKRYNTSTAKICRLNRIDENSILQIGQKLIIK